MTNVDPKKNSPGELADRLGKLQAQITELEKIEKELKGDLTKCGPGAYEGDLFRATVTVSDRATLDSKAARAKLEELGASPQWFAGNTKHTEIVTVKCAARNGNGVK